MAGERRIGAWLSSVAWRFGLTRSRRRLGGRSGGADEPLGAEVGHALDRLLHPRHIRPAALGDEIAAIPALRALESGEFGRGVRRGIKSADAIGRRELRSGVLRGLRGHRRRCPACNPSAKGKSDDPRGSDASHAGPKPEAFRRAIVRPAGSWTRGIFHPILLLQFVAPDVCRVASQRKPLLMLHDAQLDEIIVRSYGHIGPERSIAELLTIVKLAGGAGIRRGIDRVGEGRRHELDFIRRPCILSTGRALCLQS